MLDQDLSTPQRQSIYGVVIIFFKRLVKAVNIFVSVLFVQIGVRGDSFIWIAISMLVIMAIILVLSYYYYLKFRFYVKGNEFIVEKGILTKEKITVPFDRIQTVNIQQNLIQRLLSVSGVKIDTAGSAAQEIEIAALSKSYAKKIQAFLIEKKEGLANTAIEENEYAAPSSIKPPLIHLKFLDLVKIGLTENHLRTIAVFFALVNAYIWQFQDFFFGYAEQVEEQYADWMLQWAIILPVLIVLGLIVVILFSVFSAIMNFFDLKFTSDQLGVRIESGLLKRQEYQIPIQKIQYLKWYKNPLRNLVGFRSVRIKQAGSQVVGKKSSILVPACTLEHWNSIVNDLFEPNSESEFKVVKAHPWLKVQLLLLLCLIPSSLLLLLANFDETYYMYIIAALYFLISLPFSYQLANRMSLSYNAELIKVNKGWWFNTQVTMYQYKVQNVKIQQNIFQKRRDLAHLVLYTAAGRLKMWQIPYKDAIQLYNLFLYKVESSQKSWM